MKNQSIKIAASLLLFGAVMLSLGCPGTPNTNQNTNRTNSGANTGDLTVAAAPDCSGNAADKIKKVKDGVKAKIDGDSKLKPQHEAGWFAYAVAEDPTSKKLVMTVTGRIGGADQLKNFIGDINGYLKKGCVEKVNFQMTSTSASADSFEWSACEYPTRPCADGECRENCGIAANTNSNTGNKNGN